MMRSRYGRTIALIGASSALILSYKGEIAKSLVQYLDFATYSLLVIGGLYIGKLALNKIVREHIKENGKLDDDNYQP